MKKKKNNSILPLVIFVIAILIFFGCGYLLLSGLGYFNPIEKTTDVHEYQNVIGNYSVGEYEDKWGVSEEIFPASISDLDVEDFKMIHYDPMDKQFLAYLVVNYNTTTYQTEMNRLKELGIDEYEGYFGATGFHSYNLVAMFADAYQGLVYALTDNQSRIIYVELIIPNYFYDIDYKNEIPLEYLPDGFDATVNNPYRMQMMSEH